MEDVLESLTDLPIRYIRNSAAKSRTFRPSRPGNDGGVGSVEFISISDNSLKSYNVENTLQTFSLDI